MNSVVLEYIDPYNSDQVAVISYDFKENTSRGEIIEITNKDDAEIHYDVVGYIVDGELNIEEDDEYEIDYYDEFGIEDDD